MSKRSATAQLDEAERIKRNQFSFPLEANERYEGSFPVYKQPQELTCYSIDHHRRVWFDDREMKYYYPPSGKDLNVGYDQFIQRDESVSEHIDTLLDALTTVKQKHPSDIQADIVTWRGIMTKILCTPYSRRDAWELRATRYNGTIFIEEQSLKDNSRDTDRQKLMGYWGYRFETLCTVSQPPHKVNKEELKRRDNESANTNVQYCVVVKTRLGNNSIIMGAEVDCCRDRKDVKPKDPTAQLSNYIELKTSRIIETSRHDYSFQRYKLLKFWAQSFLVGVPRIICGFRNDDGLLMEVKQYKTLEIPRQVRNTKNTWNPAVCLNFANRLLDWIRHNITKDDPTTTYRIEFKSPFEEINIECTGHANVFLTQRFIEGKTLNEIGGQRATQK
ncbi:hypothetical protein G6F70_008113 [Rhizopus microsporus]|nr:hypothetical protein G6F71_008110 [Rhizopus microsporus]KAG1195595.1 hypothetical protein G6F70_008113 [Rhizopus microsporus]KAG1207426.1 hypothetical protein G6F69_008051 [Rhizopus microsporus]KAG1228208.1 hypothetical protein G6F67_007976 [Rhizopus microsporus]KAG1260354.1 hypothetical protein G6F68_007492 [Rhizopus microsporus]